MDHHDYIMDGETPHRAQAAADYQGRWSGIPMVGKQYVPRGVRLPEDDYREFQVTQGCLGCAWLRDKVGLKRPNSKACRERRLRELQGSEQGRGRERERET